MTTTWSNIFRGKINKFEMFKNITADQILDMDVTKINGINRNDMDEANKELGMEKMLALDCLLTKNLNCREKFKRYMEKKAEESKRRTTVKGGRRKKTRRRTRKSHKKRSTRRRR